MESLDESKRALPIAGVIRSRQRRQPNEVQSRVYGLPKSLVVRAPKGAGNRKPYFGIRMALCGVIFCAGTFACFNAFESNFTYAVTWITPLIHRLAVFIACCPVLEHFSARFGLSSIIERAGFLRSLPRASPHACFARTEPLNRFPIDDKFGSNRCRYGDDRSS